MTVRLSVARSVPILTAVVTAVFVSPAFHSVPLRSVLHFTSEILQTAFCLRLHLGSALLRFCDRRFCWDRSSRPGSGWAAVDREADSTSDQALQLGISLTECFCSVKLN